MAGLLVLLLFFFPRLTLIFAEDYTSWVRSYVAGYNIYSTLFSAFFAGGLYNLYYLNKRTFTSSPIALSLMPASTVEKITAMVLMSVTVYVVSFAAAMFAYLLDMLTLPSLALAENLWRDFTYLPLEVLDDVEASFLLTTATVLILLLGYFSSAYMAIRIRNFVGGLFIGFALPFIALWLFVYVLLSVDLEAIAFVGAVSEEVYTSIWAYVFLVYLLSLDSTLAYLIYRRVRTVST